MQLLHWMRRMYERFAPGLAGLLPWLGCGFLLLAAGFGTHSWMAARGQVRVTATIVENVAHFAPGGGVLYYPRLRFRTASGDIMQLTDAHGSEEAEFAPGELVPVLYPPGEPQRAVIATVWRRYPRAIVLGILGVVFVDLGLILRRLTGLRPSHSRA